MQNKIVTLALQGGGSHGAFTWGVLDRLLEDGRMTFEGISGASAGAMNAVVLAQGFNVGGRDGAREALAKFWERIAVKAPFDFIPQDFSQFGQRALTQITPAATQFMLTMSRFFSPIQLNPLDVNPLRDILAEQIDFERIRQVSHIQLFIAATRVSTGTLKIFRNTELSLDALLASACLPSMHRPVEIDGEVYWDGGLTANPPIFPLLRQCAAHDVLAVLLHPCHRPEIPVSPDEIGQRLNEISFGSSFFSELGGLALAKREAEKVMFAFGVLERRLKQLNMHIVAADHFMSQLDVASKLNTQASFIKVLYEEGRLCATRWLAHNFHMVGVTSSFDLNRYLQ